MKVRQNLVLATLGAMITVPVSSADTLDMVRDSISGSIPMEVEYNPGPYLSFNASANLLQDVDIKNVPLGTNLFVIDNGKIAFDAGFSFEMGVAVPINSDLAVEFSSGLAFNNVDSVSGIWNAGPGLLDSVAGGDGNVYQVPLVAELVWTVIDHDGFPSTSTAAAAFSGRRPTSRTSTPHRLDSQRATHRCRETRSRFDTRRASTAWSISAPACRWALPSPIPERRNRTSARRPSPPTFRG
jgi:hypothetical protein